MAYTFGPFRYDPVSRCLFRGEEEIALKPKTRELLVLFLQNPRRLLTRDDIAERIWPNTAVTDDSLRVQVFDLRKALGADAERMIKTVPREGYRWEAGRPVGQLGSRRGGRRPRLSDHPRRARDRALRGREHPREGSWRRRLDRRDGGVTPSFPDRGRRREGDARGPRKQERDLSEGQANCGSRAAHRRRRDPDRLGQDEGSERCCAGAAPRRKSERGERGPGGLYVHLPYCASRCGYCAFVVTTDGSSRERYLAALEREASLLASEAERRRASTRSTWAAGRPRCCPRRRSRACSRPCARDSRSPRAPR